MSRLGTFVRAWLWNRDIFCEYLGFGAGIALVLVAVALVAHFVFGTDTPFCGVTP